MTRMMMMMVGWGVNVQEDDEKDDNVEVAEDEVEVDDVEEEDRSQDRDPRFVRACAI